MVVAEIEQEIQVVANKSEQAERALEKGCDEYVNETITLMARFSSIVIELNGLNRHTMDAFFRQPQEVYERILPRMQALYESCIRNIESMKSSQVADSLTTLIYEFEVQSAQLKKNQDSIRAYRRDINESAETKALRNTRTLSEVVANAEANIAAGKTTVMTLEQLGAFVNAHSRV